MALIDNTTINITPRDEIDHSNGRSGTARSDGKATKGKGGRDRAPSDLTSPPPMPTKKHNATMVGQTGKLNKPVTVTSLGSSSKSRRTAASDSTKANVVLKKLRMARGVTIAQLAEATGWQLHSVRGFLSAAVRKKLGLDLVSEIGKDGIRRYRIAGEELQGGVSEPGSACTGATANPDAVGDGVRKA